MLFLPLFSSLKPRFISEVNCPADEYTYRNPKENGHRFTLLIKAARASTNKPTIEQSINKTTKQQITIVVTSSIMPLPVL